MLNAVTRREIGTWIITIPIYVFIFVPVVVMVAAFLLIYGICTGLSTVKDFVSHIRDESLDRPR